MGAWQKIKEVNLKVGFWLGFGNGDLYESRNFALAVMRLAGVTTADYAHKPQYFGSFIDLPQLRHVPIQAWMNPSKSLIQHGDTLWFNAWIGRSHDQKMNGYVLQPGVGCVLERLMQLWNDMTIEAGLPLLDISLQECIPTLDYSQVYIAPALRNYLNANIGRKLVLVCNGKTTSHQCTQFDYHPILDYLPMREDVNYLFTERVKIIGRGDVTFTDDLTERMTHPIHHGWDLNAISYLSRFCDVIVGRCSGAQMYCQTLEAWMNSRKTLVCFTTHRNGSCFVRYPESLGLKMRVLWSPATNAKDAAEVIKPLLA